MRAYQTRVISPVIVLPWLPRWKSTEIASAASEFCAGLGKRCRRKIARNKNGTGTGRSRNSLVRALSPCRRRESGQKCNCDCGPTATAIALPLRRYGWKTLIDYFGKWHVMNRAVSQGARRSGRVFREAPKNIYHRTTTSTTTERNIQE